MLDLMACRMNAQPRLLVDSTDVASHLQGASLASLASAPSSVAFARFARSITGRDELARFNYSECGLRSLRSLTHMA